MRMHCDGWLLELYNDAGRHWVAGQSFDLNSQASSVLASDKVAVSAVLSADGIPHVEHHLFSREDCERQDVSSIQKELVARDVILKPLNGHSGNLVRRISSAEQARQHIVNHPGVVWAYSGFREIESELRLVVLDGTVQLALRKKNPVMHADLKMFNLSKGASAEHVDVRMLNKDITSYALRAMNATGLRLAAVDIIIGIDGTIEVLEINATFSLMRYAKINDATYSEVASFYDRLIGTIFTD